MKEIFLGFVKILKPSDRLSLQVIEGLKHTHPSVLLASRFLSFLDGVSDRLSCWSPILRGLNLGVIRCMRDTMSSAHAWGFWQPLARSWVQSVHGHRGLETWGRCWFVVCRRADVEIRSVMVVTACFLSRHLAVVVVRGLASAFRWYQAGSRACRCGVIHIGAKACVMFPCCAEHSDHVIV